MKRFLAMTALALSMATPAWAGDFKLGTVDYSRAIQEIDEGKAAQARLDAMYAGEKAKLEQLEIELQALNEEYESKKAILSDTAREDYEIRLQTKWMEYQQAYGQADLEMQTAYFSAMETLMAGLKTTTEKVGAEGGYDLILETSTGVVLYSKTTVDMTDTVIERYNSTH